MTSARVSAAHLARIRSSLSDRDLFLLGSFQQHPFLTTMQLQRWHFADHATGDTAGRVCRRVLQRLSSQRVIEHLRRRIGGVRAGSASFVWRLGPIGDRLLRDASAGRSRRGEPSLHHLAHSLEVAEIHLRLLESGRQLGGLALLSAETEPTCWRSYLGPDSAPAILKPDLYAVTAPSPSDDFEDHWFLEIDRGTESLPTLLRKCQQYEQYRRTGQEQQRLGVFPRVLWLLPDHQHVGRLSAAITRARSLDSELFKTATPAELLPVMTEEPV